MTKKNEGKIYVLDTSVLLFDHSSIKNFEENDVAIPITVLEELDKFKIGNDTKNFEAREVIRFLDKLSGHYTFKRWVNLGDGLGKFKVIMNEEVDKNGINAENIYGYNKNDHKILNACIALAQSEKNKRVVLVTKDINLRLKAKAIDIIAEDYESVKVKNVENLAHGMATIENLDSRIIQKLYSHNFIEEDGILNGSKIANGYYILKNGKASSLCFYNEENDTIERVEKTFASNIKPRNAEQSFAVHALMNNNIRLVAVQGVAGTGKTLLALACAIEQQKQYKQIILARPIIPLSNKDIGYLPGDANEKISPYMQPLWDNLKFIKSQFKETEKKYKAIEEMVQQEKISITPLAFIRGRSLSNVMFIIDEAQNLTPHEVKTIITRAGEGTKVVFTGDIHQIDTPYMDEQSN
ncbi:MAG: PhoH family protein, partial [Bacteroidia bacterium]